VDKLKVCRKVLRGAARDRVPHLTRGSPARQQERRSHHEKLLITSVRKVGVPFDESPVVVPDEPFRDDIAIMPQSRCGSVPRVLPYQNRAAEIVPVAPVLHGHAGTTARHLTAPFRARRSRLQQEASAVGRGSFGRGSCSVNRSMTVVTLCSPETEALPPPRWRVARPRVRKGLWVTCGRGGNNPVFCVDSRSQTVHDGVEPRGYLRSVHRSSTVWPELSTGHLQGCSSLSCQKDGSPQLPQPLRQTRDQSLGKGDPPTSSPPILGLLPELDPFQSCPNPSVRSSSPPPPGSRTVVRT
jgi:hypothetical protein